MFRRLIQALSLSLLIGEPLLVKADPCSSVPTATPAQINLSPVAPPAGQQDAALPTPTRTPTRRGIALLEAKDFANVRAEPSTDSAQLGTIRAGETYNVIGRICLVDSVPVSVVADGEGLGLWRSGQPDRQHRQHPGHRSLSPGSCSVDSASAGRDRDPDYSHANAGRRTDGDAARTATQRRRAGSSRADRQRDAAKFCRPSPIRRGWLPIAPTPGAPISTTRRRTLISQQRRHAYNDDRAADCADSYPGWGWAARFASQRAAAGLRSKIEDACKESIARFYSN